MNEIDIKIIRLLQSNGKLSYSEIGESVELSITAVKERIKKLVNSNVLGDNVYIPNPNMLEFDICAFVQVLMPSPAEENNFISKVNTVAEIQECHFITGEYSYLLKIRVKKSRDLEKVLAEKIKTIEGVQRTNTIMVLSTYKENLKLSI